jgi:hypothetical protein
MVVLLGVVLIVVHRAAVDAPVTYRPISHVPG